MNVLQLFTMYDAQDNSWTKKDHPVSDTVMSAALHALGCFILHLG